MSGGKTMVKHPRKPKDVDPIKEYEKIIKGYKDQVKDGDEVIERCKAEISNLKIILDGRDKRVRELEKKNYNLSMRLDAALYSMVLIQDQVKQASDRANNLEDMLKKADNLALAT